MTYRVNHSRGLHRARNRGAEIVVAEGPFVGHEAAYCPRSPRDPQPWVVAGHRLVRLSGKQCRTKDPVHCRACGGQLKRKVS